MDVRGLSIFGNRIATYSYACRIGCGCLDVRPAQVCMHARARARACVCVCACGRTSCMQVTRLGSKGGAASFHGREATVVARRVASELHVRAPQQQLASLAMLPRHCEVQRTLTGRAPLARLPPSVTPSVAPSAGTDMGTHTRSFPRPLPLWALSPAGGAGGVQSTGAHT